MKQFRLTLLVLLVANTAFIWLGGDREAAFAGETEPQPKTEIEGLAGSVSCRQCHERFYELWAVSNHGLAMQPYTSGFSEQNLMSQKEAISVNKTCYKAEIGSGQGWIVASREDGEKKYPIEHVMGGKNVYYFLTSLDRGRLQTLPIAYDVNKKRWFDTAASGVRHFPEADTDEPVHWTDPMYTFNTSCYNCHVSQLSTNYDLKTDTYHTQWAEPGINCETCHGPSREHVKVCQAAPEGKPPKDLKIIITRKFTHDQMNSMCNSCHAKMMPVSSSFQPGDHYYDHFDLVTLESPDYYPDGRDLGENYTMTSWSMSPCVKSGTLDCMHCHTSSGRYRHKDNPNQSCLVCHKNRVENVAEHTHHPAAGEGNKCIECHMPMTQFAHMNRTDHSMRPPAPAATIAFKSPNACNMCHKDKDAKWADNYVRQWHKDDYQETALESALLIDAARRQDWKRLDDMLLYVERENREEVTAASLIRLLRACNSDRKWNVIIKTLQGDHSPLVRAASAEALDGYLTGDSLTALLNATRDEYRLVRVRAAASLANIDPDRLQKDAHRQGLEQATAELVKGMNSRGDDYTSNYNLGNFYMARQDFSQALTSYQASIKLRPDFTPPYVNAAFVYNAQGHKARAETSLRKALAIEPNHGVANLNLGLLLGELGRFSEAAKAFRTAYKNDPNSVVAAYNLGVILASDQPEESILWCQKAYKLHPEEGKYGYTYAFYLNQSGDTDEAIKVLKDMVNRQVTYTDSYVLLGDLYLRNEEPDKARDIYRLGKDNRALSESERDGFGRMMRSLDY